ncbi:hypothetical protein IU427_31610 [Nocardia beijingensis]|uniref:hypothetical protein n=1 Tax=Nocardia beijingensis TaxID=95162 RepID=UPI0018932C75|nr:hypothetical protein [Nocardia beijingensis]MBF6469680.1 hypothetical protein [Nocardia beijingensis]
MQPTPWSTKGTRPEPVPATERRLAGIRDHLSALDGHWGYLGALVGSIVTLLLLFQPWLNAVGADGRARANAFGRITATTSFLNAWSSSPPPTARISGAMAILAAGAIVVTVCVVAANLRYRTEVLARAVTVSAVVTAALVVLTVLYVNSKAPELRGMLGRSSDLGGQIGMVTSWAFGNGSLLAPGVRQVSYNTAGLTHWALLAGVVSLGSAVAAVAQWTYSRTSSSRRLPPRRTGTVAREPVRRAE